MKTISIYYCILTEKKERKCVNIKLEECFFNSLPSTSEEKVKGPKCNKYKMAPCWTKRQIMWFACKVEHCSTYRPERSLVWRDLRRETDRFTLHLEACFSLQFSEYKAIKWIKWVHLREMTGSLSRSYRVFQGPDERQKESRMDRFGERQTILHRLLPSHWIMWHGRQRVWFEKE